jgi:hypothetical protein
MGIHDHGADIMTAVPLPPESKALIERLVKERDAAQDRLDVAVIATKAALGVPVEYDIKNLDIGFEGVDNDGNN